MGIPLPAKAYSVSSDITKYSPASPFIVFLLAARAAVPAPSKDREGLGGTKALDYVHVLAGAEFENRKAGLPGGAKASVWIVKGS